MVKISGYSKAKIFRIIHHWLDQEPPALSKQSLKAKYLLFDGTYFHKDGCLAILMNVLTRRPIDYWYIVRENYPDVYARLAKLKQQGLNPIAITLDGHKSVIEAVKAAWCGITIQRCLFHVENQGLMWIRTHPKTEAGRELRQLLKSVTSIRSGQDRAAFLYKYRCWRNKYAATIKTLASVSIAGKDLKRTMALIDHALPNMFCFIKDRNIAATTNLLESFYSQLRSNPKTCRR